MRAVPVSFAAPTSSLALAGPTGSGQGACSPDDVERPGWPLPEHRDRLWQERLQVAHSQAGGPEHYHRQRSVLVLLVLHVPVRRDRCIKSSSRRELQEFAVLLALPAHPLGAADVPAVRERAGQGIRDVLIQQDLRPNAG